MDILHSMHAERLVLEVITALDSAMYQSSYETRLVNKLKQAVNHMHEGVGAKPVYNFDE